MTRHLFSPLKKYFNIALIASLGLSGCMKVNEYPDEVADLELLSVQGYNFGEVVIGKTNHLFVNIRNRGVLHADSIKVSPVLAPFSLSTTCHSRLKMGQRCEVDLSFTPSARGSASQEITVNYYDGKKDQSATVTISGGGLSPAKLEIAEGTAYDFGTVVVGNQKTHLFTFTNTGDVKAEQLAFPTGLLDVNAQFSIISNNCGSALASTASCEMELKARPTDSTLRMGSLSMNYHDGVADLSVATSLQMQGKLPALLSISMSDPVNYGTVTIGGLSALIFTITNQGESTAASISLIALAAPFSVTGNTCGSSLASLATCDITVTFSPSTDVTSQSNLTVNYFDQVANHSVSRAIKGTGQTAASITISQSPGFDFGNVVIGNSVNQEFEIKNEGQASATTVAFTAISAPFSMVANTCGATIAGSATCTLTVGFAPTISDAFNTSLIIDYNNGVSGVQSTRSVIGSGKTPAQVLISESPSYNFQEIVLGNSSDKSFDISNSGEATATALTFTSLSAPFSISANTCGSSLAGGASCAVTVTFTPTVAEDSSASIVIDYHDGVSAEQSVRDIEGTGITRANLVFSDAPAKDFGTVLVGATQVMSISLSNSGQATATSLSFDMGTNSPFAIDGSTCTATLEANTSCDVSIRYEPTSAVSNENLITANFNDGVAGAATTRTLTGMGNTPAALVLSMSSPIEFGSLIIGNSQTIFVDVMNEGQGSASDLSVSTLIAPFETVMTDCTDTLAGGEECQVELKFTPTLDGNFDALFTVSYSNGLLVVNLDATLTGSGIEPAILSISESPSFDFETILIGNSSAHTFTISNDGGSSANSLSIASMGAPFEVTSNDCDSELGAGEECEVEVTFTPTSNASFSAQLTANYEDGFQSQATEVAVEGAGLGLGTLTITAVDGSDFGSVPIGNSSDKTFKITHSGNGPASSITLPSLNSPYSIQSNDCPSSLDSLAFCSAVVRFTPTATGAIAGQITADYFDGQSNQSSSLNFNGTGTAFTVFVSSLTFNGNMGGLTGADEQCQSLATSSGRAGIWRAILSDAFDDAKVRVSFSGSLYNVSSQLVSSSHSGLFDGSIDNAIRYDENGVDRGSVDIWTGSLSDGTKSSSTCTSWSASTGSGVNGKDGDASETDAKWLSESTTACSSSRGLYCINSNVNYALLSALSGASGSVAGYADLNIDFPASTTNYDKVKILRQKGSLAPSCRSTTATEVEEYSLFTDTTLSDNTERPGQTFAYRACVFDSLNAPLTSRSTIVRSAGQAVFVTSTTYKGDLGGLSGADSKCSTVASAAGLTGTWKAMISDASVNAKDRISLANELYNFQGQKVADNQTDLWDGGIDNAILYDENGTSASSAEIWTGTLSDGTKSSSTCSNWTSASGSGSTGRVGTANQSDDDWVSDTSSACNNSKRLYCVLQ